MVIKTIPKKKKCKKAKWLCEEALQIAGKKREAKGKGEKERYIHLNAEFQRIARKDKKVFTTLEILSESPLYRQKKTRTRELRKLVKLGCKPKLSGSRPKH